MICSAIVNKVIFPKHVNVLKPARTSLLRIRRKKKSRKSIVLIPNLVKKKLIWVLGLYQARELPESESLQISSPKLRDEEA